MKTLILLVLMLGAGLAEVFFEHVYTYYPSGKLRRVKATNPKGVETVWEYRESARAGFFW